jgi:hypothetical protein
MQNDPELKSNDTPLTAGVLWKAIYGHGTVTFVVDYMPRWRSRDPIQHKQAVDTMKVERQSHSLGIMKWSESQVSKWMLNFEKKELLDKFKNGGKPVKKQREPKRRRPRRNYKNTRNK